MTDPDSLQQLLEAVRAGELPVTEAAARLRHQQLGATQPELDFATIDHRRSQRCGFAEVVFCQGKTPANAAAIAVEIAARSDQLLLTRADPAHAEAVKRELPSAVYHQRARCITVERQAIEPAGLVAVVCAGTADLPVAEEAAVTLAITGSRVERFVDVGVAGLHRLLQRVDEIRRANAIVVVAGMEGALPSVVGGLVQSPVIAVPTSVGYGASLGGLSALLTMLNSCAAGIAVVNIDNGFGAGYLASRINRQTTRPSEHL